MRVPPVIVSELRDAIAPLDTDYWRDKYRAGDYPRSEVTKDLDVRYRWDLFHATGLSASGWTHKLYATGVNDEHLDTALRAVVPSLWRPATAEETADYLAGNRTFLAARETIEGLEVGR